MYIIMYYNLYGNLTYTDKCTCVGYICTTSVHKVKFMSGKGKAWKMKVNLCN